MRVAQGFEVHDVGEFDSTNNVNDLLELISQFPIPGVVAIHAIETGTFDGLVDIQGSLDKSNWATLLADVAGGGGFEIVAPWPYIRFKLTNTATGGNKLAFIVGRVW